MPGGGSPPAAHFALQGWGCSSRPNLLWLCHGPSPGMAWPSKGLRLRVPLTNRRSCDLWLSLVGPPPSGSIVFLCTCFSTGSATGLGDSHYTQVSDCQTFLPHSPLQLITALLLGWEFPFPTVAWQCWYLSGFHLSGQHPAQGWHWVNHTSKKQSHSYRAGAQRQGFRNHHKTLVHPLQDRDEM